MKTVLCGIRGETGGYSKKKDSGLLVKWKLFGLNNREADSESQSGGPVTQGGISKYSIMDITDSSGQEREKKQEKFLKKATQFFFCLAFRERLFRKARLAFNG